MTEIETLARRRELVLLSAQLQRATITRRLDHIHSNPARVAIGLVSRLASVPLAWTVGTKALRMALRAYRGRTPRRRAPAT